MSSESKNLWLAIALSILVMVGWGFVENALFPPPPAPPESAQQDAGAQNGASSDGAIPQASPQASGDAADVPSAADVPGSADAAAAATLDRDEVLAKTPRITIDTPKLAGSINLKGGRIDDLTLKEYRESLDEGSPRIDLLHPAGSATPYFAEYGWTPIEGVESPKPDAVWQADGKVLAPGSPVTLSWENADGVRFEQLYEVDENYLFTVTQRVVNSTDNAITVSPFGRIRRTGTPDTIDFYILHEGLIGVFQDVLEERDYDDVAEEPRGVERFTSTGGWLGITDKYWLVSMVPQSDQEISARFLHLPIPDAYQVDYVPSEAMNVAPGATAENKARLFAGAKLTTLLDRYSEEYGIKNFDLAVDFGWFYFLTKPIFHAIHFLNGVLGNFGLAILALTLGIKIIFFPLANKSYKSMSKMKLLQPKVQEFRERYGDDKMKMNQALMELYKKEKVNPLSGCLPILVQIPVFFALYKVLFVTIEMRHAPFFGWIQDLSAPDPLGMLTLFGLIPWDVPGLLQVLNIGLWPLIMGASMFLQQKLNPPPSDPVQQKIFTLMPIFFTFLLAGFPAGLVIYWAWNNTLSILQQYVIMRRMGVAIGGGKAKS